MPRTEPASDQPMAQGEPHDPSHEIPPFPQRYRKALADAQLGRNVLTFQRSWRERRDGMFAGYAANPLRPDVDAATVAHSPVPVVLYRPGGKRVTAISTILVPVDGSAGGALALGAAAPLARITGAKLVLVQVAVPILSVVATTPDSSLSYAYDPAWDDEALAAAQRSLESGVSAKDAGVSVMVRELIQADAAY